MNMEEAARILNAAHLGDDLIKQLLLDRILGSWLVSETGSRHRGRPLLLVGPPGCGKTSLARSAAREMGRACVFVSVPTAARDGVYLLGCSRVYRGAEPGVIIKAVRSAGTSRVLLVLDELDKTFDGSGSASPSAASCLLELLDGSHATWTDRYLEVPFDLSEVFFIATANSLESVPDALVDRYLVVELQGLNPAERVEVAREQIWPQLLAHYGLAEGLFPLDDDALRHLVLECARPGETGLRGAESQLEACLLGRRREALTSYGPYRSPWGSFAWRWLPSSPGAEPRAWGSRLPNRLTAPPATCPECKLLGSVVPGAEMGRQDGGGGWAVILVIAMSAAVLVGVVFWLIAILTITGSILWWLKDIWHDDQPGEIGYHLKRWLAPRWHYPLWELAP